MFAKLGLAYDLKETNPLYLKKIIQGCGDRSHPYCNSMPDEIPYEETIAS